MDETEYEAEFQYRVDERFISYEEDTVRSELQLYPIIVYCSTLRQYEEDNPNVTGRR